MPNSGLSRRKRPIEDNENIHSDVKPAMSTNSRKRTRQVAQPVDNTLAEHITPDMSSGAKKRRNAKTGVAKTDKPGKQVKEEKKEVDVIPAQCKEEPISDAKVTADEVPTSAADVPARVSATGSSANINSVGDSQIPAPERPQKKGKDKYNKAWFTVCLQRCVESDTEALADLKDLAKGARGLELVEIHMKCLANDARIAFNTEWKDRSVVEPSLFYGYVSKYRKLVDSVGALLETTHPGSNKRVTGLGRIAFAMAFGLVREYCTVLYLYSQRDPSAMEGLPSVRPASKDNIQDRLDAWNATQGGVSALDDLDVVLADAVTRYRKESRGVQKSLEERLDELEALADEIGDLSGFGGQKNHGYELFQLSKKALRKWLDNEPIPKDNQVFIVPAWY